MTVGGRIRLSAALMLAGAWLMGAAPVPGSLTNMVRDMQLGAAPLTVDLLPQAEFASALRAGGDAPIALAVEGIEGAVVQPVRINVFINRPDAGPATSSEDPSCIGFIQLLPTRGTVRAVSHAFELPGARSLDLTKPIRVTLVPVIGTSEAPRDVSLRVGRIYLRREG
jgi:hypothetical protein